MNQYPIVYITDEGKQWLLKGQRWMYRNNLLEEVDYSSGDIVQIQSKDGTYLATGFYHATSHIVVRILTENENEIIDNSFFEKRIEDALKYRFVVEKDNLDNCRLIFGDADLLPGLTVDRYNDVLVTQVTSFAIEQRKDFIYQLLLNILNKNNQTVKYIYERNDVQARTKEGLELYKGFYGKQTCSTDLVISENHLLLNVDIQNGQKTGYFLDQKSNRMLIRDMAKGLRVLDCFTHTGGFALNAAKGEAKSVTAVDVSGTALEEARKNAEINHFTNMTFVQADVFDYLEEMKEGEFDLIILDPPAFTKSRKTVKQAYYGYKRINLEAMKKLENGGFLATCSCSRYMETSLFEQMLKEAALEANVLLKQVSVTQQNHDHPILWSMEETSYLKFFIFQIVKEK